MIQECLTTNAMKGNILIIIFTIFTLSVTSCYYDIEEELYPVNKTNCDTANTKLSSKIKPILNKSCYMCHSAANAINMGAGINLETYTELKKYVDNSKLIMSVKHESGAWAMPKGTTNKIPVCDINLIEYWISKGAKND